MVIFPAHILTMAMRTSGWGTTEIVRRGETGSPERCGDCCSLERERTEEGGRVEMEEA